MSDTYEIAKLLNFGCLSKGCSKVLTTIFLFFSIIFAISLCVYASLTSKLSADFREDKFYGINGPTNTYDSSQFTRLVAFLVTAALTIFITSLVMIFHICSSSKQGSSKSKAKTVMVVLLVNLGFTLASSAVLGGNFLSYHSRWSSFFNNAFFNANSSTQFMDMVRLCTYFALLDFAVGSSVVLPMVAALAYSFLSAISEQAGKDNGRESGKEERDSFQMIQSDV